jgi:hypothetical protein
MSNINKIKDAYDEIISRFDKLGGYEIFYDLNSEKLKPIVVANDEESLKNLMEKKIKKKPEKYKKAKLVRIKVLRYPKNIGKDKSQMKSSGGSFGIMAMVYNIDDDFDLSRANEDRQQGFWYSDDEILDRGFSSKDIKKIIKVVYKNLVDMSPFKIYQISDVDKLVKKN